MAPLNSFPWQGTTPGSAGPYSAAQFAAFFDGLYRNTGAESGIILGSNRSSAPPLLLVGFGLDVYQAIAPNMSVNVGTGMAVVNGTFVEATAINNLVIGANVSGLTRIDTVVIHLDYVAQTAVVQVNQGTPAGSPVPPTLIQSAGVTWEIPLADVTVANGAATITTANITPRATPASMPQGLYMTVLNNSGQTLVTGDVVVWDTTAQQAVTTSTTVADQNVAGVVVGRIGSARNGLILVKGIGWVNTNNAITNGNALVQSGTAKQASFTGPIGSIGAFAYAMSTTSGSGLIPAFVDASRVNADNLGYIFQKGLTNAEAKFNNGADYTTASTSFTDMDTTNLAVTIVPVGTKALVTVQIPSITTTGATVNVDVAVNGVRWGGTNGLARYDQTSTAHIPISISVIVTGLSAGVSTTFKIQWKTNAGTATAQCNGDFISLSAMSLMGA